MRALLVVALSAASGSAHADERTTTVTFGGLVLASPDAAYEESDSAQIGGRFALSWEHDRVRYPDDPGYNVDVTLVPELSLASVRDDHRFESLVGAGLRGELRVAQREQGLFKVSMRASFYAAVRGSVIGKYRDPIFEYVIGEYFYLGRDSNKRLGIEVGYFDRTVNPMLPTPPADAGLQVQVYFGVGL